MDSFIFVHIYRCGGTTIRNIINKTQPIKNQYKSHSTALEIKQYYSCNEEYFNNTFKFSFVRNPFDWVVSLYSFIRQYEQHVFHKYACQPFEEFCIWYCNAIKNKIETKNGGLHTLTEFLYDNEGCLLVDFVGKLENIKNDFKKVFEKINMPYELIPKNNASERDSDYKKYYTFESKIIIENIFENDLNNFNYKF